MTNRKIIPIDQQRIAYIEARDKIKKTIADVGNINAAGPLHSAFSYKLTSILQTYADVKHGQGRKHSKLAEQVTKDITDDKAKGSWVSLFEKCDSSGPEAAYKEFVQEHLSKNN